MIGRKIKVKEIPIGKINPKNKKFQKLFRKMKQNGYLNELMLYKI